MPSGKHIRTAEQCLTCRGAQFNHVQLGGQNAVVESLLRKADDCGRCSTARHLQCQGESPSPVLHSVFYHEERIPRIDQNVVVIIATAPSDSHMSTLMVLKAAACASSAWLRFWSTEYSCMNPLTSCGLQEVDH